MNEAALAIKVTTDAKEAVSGLSETSDGLTGVSDAATSAGKISGQTARALGGLGKGLKLIGQDQAAEYLQQTGMALQFVKGTSGLAKLGMDGYKSTVGAVSKAQGVLNAVMAANPILLIVIAVVALAAAFVIAYKKSETFRNIVNGVAKGISKAFAAAVGFIKNNWQKLLVILTGPIGLAVVAIVKHRDKILGAISGVKDWISGKWSAVKDLLSGPIGRAKDAIGRSVTGIREGIVSIKEKAEEIRDKIGSALSTAFQPFKDAYTWVKDLISKIGDLIAKLKDVPGTGLLGQVADAVSRSGARTSRGGLAIGAGTLSVPVGDVHVHIHLPFGFIGSERQLAAELKRILGNELRRLAGAGA